MCESVCVMCVCDRVLVSVDVYAVCFLFCFLSHHTDDPTTLRLGRSDEKATTKKKCDANLHFSSTSAMFWIPSLYSRRLQLWPNCVISNCKAVNIVFACTLGQRREKNNPTCSSHKNRSGVVSFLHQLDVIILPFLPGISRERV